MIGLSNRQALVWCLVLALGLSFFGIGGLATVKQISALLTQGLSGSVALGGPLSIALGGVYLSLAFGSTRRARYCLLLLLLFSSLLLLSSAIQELGQRASVPQISLRPALPFLIIIGCFGALLGLRKSPPRWLITTLALVLVLVGGVHLIAPQSSLPAWAGLTSQPNLSFAKAVLVVIFGASITLLPVLSRARMTRYFRSVIYVGVVGVIVTLAVWQVALTRYNESVARQASLVASNTAEAIGYFFEKELNSVLRMAERFEAQSAQVSSALWQQEADSYFRDLPFLEVIAILDHRMEIQRLDMREFSLRVWLHNLLKAPAFRQWYSQTRQGTKPEVHSSALFLGPQEQAWSFFAAPIRVSEKQRWFLLVMADVEASLQWLSQQEVSGFNVTLSSGERVLFDRGNIPSDQRKMVLQRKVDSTHDNWMITVYRPLYEGYLAQYLTELLILLGGLVLTTLAMISRLFGVIATGRNQLLTRRNHELSGYLERETELRAINQRIIDFSSDLLCNFDHKGVFLFISPASFQILGFAPEDMKNCPIRNFIFKADLEKTLQAMHQHLVGSTAANLALRNRFWHRDGHLVTLDWKIRLSSSDGTLFCVGRDVTAELKAEELARQHKAFFSLTPEMFCIVSENRFIEANRAFLSAFGFSQDEVIGRSYLNLVHRSYHEVIARAIEQMAHGKPVYELEILVFYRDGSPCWLRLNAAMENQRIYCSARDITYEKSVQQALKEKGDLLSMAEKLGRLGGWSFNLGTQQPTWTDAVCDIHELPHGDVPNLEQALNFYTSEYREKIATAVQQASELGLPFDLEAKIVTAKGRLCWVRAIGQAVRSTNGEIVALQGALQDITESKEASEQIRRLAESQATIFESITDGFFTVNKKWVITFANQKAEQLIGFSRSEAVGKNFWEVFPQLIDSEFHRQYHAALESDTTASFEAFFTPRNLWLEVNAYPSEEGLAVYFRSINKRKQAEKERDESIAELKRSNRELQDFAFVASHDLQEPLRKIQMFSDRLLHNVQRFNEREQDYLRRMENAANRMQTLIRDLLSFSRVSTGAQPFQKCNLNHIVDEVLIDLEAVIAESNAQIEVSVLPPVIGDPSQLRQVLQNLLSNAVKFRRPNINPVVCIYAGKLSDQGWCLTVEDNGIGFQQKYADRMFLPFQRLHSRKDYTGTGIGLAVVRKIIERHEGRVEAESKFGSGATFRIYFPNPLPIETAPGGNRLTE